VGRSDWDIPVWPVVVLEVSRHMPLAFGLMKLRGFLTVATIGGFLVLAEVVQRLIIVPLAWTAPARRDRVLQVWLRGLASAMIGGVRLVGGGKFRPLPTIPFAPGVLVLMNHQSLLDIPLVVRCVEGGYLRIVTRKRYARGVPVISRMLKLYDFPVVDPRGGMKGQLKVLRDAARDPRVPIVVYPEGTRSRDGELLPFRRGAVDTLLRHRQWKVYLATADGTLPCGRLKDMLNGVQTVDCRVSVSGPFDTPTNPKDFPAWIEEMEGRMRKDLTELRRPLGVSNRIPETHAPETHAVETSRAEASKAEAMTEQPE
jgi:1-acyl-sn-glycerol-3-phosphate acyltransferase